MNPKKLTINKNLFGARSWRSCLQLPVALAILCWSSLAHAQFQTETWVGTNTSVAVPYGWTNSLNWINAGGAHQAVSLKGDALIFGASPTNVSQNTFTNAGFGIYSITFTTNGGYVLSGNALQITNGITDNSDGGATPTPTRGGNSESMALTLGASQTFANNSTVIGTNTTYFTNTDSGTINLSTNALTIGGGAPFFLNGAITSTNGGQVIVANGGGYPNGVARLSVSNSFGINVVQITNLFIGAGTFTPAITNYYTNSYVVAGVSTNFFVFSNVVASVTNGTTTNFINTFGPQNRDAVVVQSGGTLQVANLGAIPSAVSGVGNIGNLSVDGTLDLNGTSININGLDDAQSYGGVIDNFNPANTGTYILTLGYGNSNAVFTGTIGNSSGGATAGTIALTKTGYGTETLANANYYAGQTLINQGKLVVTTGGSLGALSALMTIQPGAVLDVSGLGAQGYIPQNSLTVAAGTPTKPYTNFLGSYDPVWGTNPTNYVVTTTTNNVLTYVTNTDLATFTNVVATTNIASFSYSTNSIISIVTADVYGNFTVNGGGAISPLTPIAPGIATWAIQGNLTLDNSLGLSAPLNNNRVNYLLNNVTTPGGGTNDLIRVSGTLKIGDELDFIISPLNGALANGDYTLITSSSYVPETGGHTPVFKVVLERGLQGDSVSAVGNNIVLHSVGGAAAPGSIIWAGTPAANNWDVDLTSNWQTNGPTYPNPDYFFPDDNVTFNDNGVGTVNLSVVVTPGSLTFNNNKTNITFVQSQSVFLTGSGGLTMNGSGTVTLQNPNSFTGDVVLNNGTLNLGYHSTASPQYVLYNGVPAGNLKMGGGTINQITQQNTAPFAAFSNLILMPGASGITQTARTASQSPRYFFTNQVVRTVGGVLNLDPTTGNNCGIYFLYTNTPGGITYYGANGMLGGYATIFLNDWVLAPATGTAGSGAAVAYGAYQTDNNPANWGAASNVMLNANPSASVNTMTINSLKINTSGSYTLNINPGQTLTLASGGLLIPTSGGYLNQAINGGTLMGAVTNDLVIINNNSVSPSSLTIGSVIADNGGPTALTMAGGGITILTGNNIYTGPTYILNGERTALGPLAAGTLQIGANGTSGDISHSSAVIDNGVLAFNRSDNTSVSGAISGSGSLTKLSAGVLTLTANNTLGGLVTISAGTLQLGNGGAAGSVSNTVGIVDNGVLAFDNNNTVSYPNPISGYGSLVQFGTGNLVIATNELYTGNTVVSNGTLTVAASGSISNTAAIIVKGGATLDVSAVSGGLVLRSATPSEILSGSGTVNGSVTTASGATLSPGGDGAIGTMTINNNLTLAGGTFNFDVATTASHDLVSAGGTLILNSGTVVISGTPAPGVYPLFHYASGVIGATANLGLFAPAGVNAQLIVDTPNNNLDLLVSAIGNAAPLTWVGDGSANVWDVNNTPNWTAGAGAVNYANPDYATFDDTGSAATPVNITVAVSPSSVTNNAATKNYVLGANTGSAGKILGGAILVQNGASQLTLQTLNTYLGGTKINAGTVQLGNNTAAAEDGMVGSGGSVVIGAGGALVVSNFASETLSSSLSGSGQFVQQGVGKLVLTGDNSAFTGPISINTNGNGGKVFLQMGNGTAGTLGSGNVTNNSVLLTDVGPTPVSTVVVAANITGGGSITNIGPGTVVLAGTNSYTGNTVIPSGTIQLGSDTALPSNTAVIMNNNNSPGAVGTLDLNGHDASINNLSGNNTGNASSTLVECQIVNNGSGMATLTIGDGTATTFNGQILDNNNSGSGKLALLVTNGTALTLNACYNNSSSYTYPSLFSGGIIISNATVALESNPGGSAAWNVATFAGGGGTITMLGGHGTNIVQATGLPTNAVLYAAAASGSSGPTMSSAVSTINIPTGEYGTISLPQRGTFTTSLAGGGTVIISTSYVRARANIGDAGFTGTAILAALNLTGSAGGNLGLDNRGGWPDANVVLMTNNPATLELFGTVGGNVLPWGSLSGGDNTVQLQSGTTSTGDGGANTIFAIGSMNQNTTNVVGAQFVDGGTGLRKVGIGTLILTNSVLSFGGQLVVSNGTLGFAPLGLVIDSIITNVDTTTTTNFVARNYLTNTTYLVGSNVTIVSPGVLDLSQVGDNTLHLGHNGTQTLFGDGTIKGNLIATNNLIAPAWGASGRGTFPGPLTITGNAEIDLGSTIQMAVSPTAYDSLTVGGTLTINRAKFAVISAGGTAFPPTSTNVFQFFQGAVTVNIGGASGITNITVFTNLPAGMSWVTNLDGTLAGYPTVPAGAMAIVNTNAGNPLNASAPPLQVSVSGGTLTLGWPTNLGWILQTQTNGSGIGLTPATNWFDVAGSATQTNAVITITATNPAVFYRLRNPTAPPQ